MLIPCYIRMMLLWIKNRDCYGLKISELLKENHPKDPNALGTPENAHIVK